MAEDKIKKQNPEELQDEQLEKVNGGFTITLKGLKDSEIQENAE